MYNFLTYPGRNLYKYLHDFLCRVLPGSTIDLPMLRTDRNIVFYIIFTVFTLGIYGYYFIYQMAQDVNTVYKGNGARTGGLVFFMIMCIITFGIYSWYWYYNVGDRLHDSAPAYGMYFRETGTTILILYLIGFLIFFVGSFYAVYILIRNTNAICEEYNRQNRYVIN